MSQGGGRYSSEAARDLALIFSGNDRQCAGREVTSESREHRNSEDRDEKGHGRLAPPAPIRADLQAPGLGRAEARDRPAQADRRGVGIRRELGDLRPPARRQPGRRRPARRGDAPRPRPPLTAKDCSGRRSALASNSRSWSSSSTPARTSRSRSTPTTSWAVAWPTTTARPRPGSSSTPTPAARSTPGSSRGPPASRWPRPIEKGTVESLLHSFEAKAGDCILIPAGTVHAIGAGVVLAEFQQMSDATFRLHDWNRVGLDGKPRQLHIAESLESIDFGAGPVSPDAHDPRADPRRDSRAARPVPTISPSNGSPWTARPTVGEPDRFTILLGVDGRGRGPLGRDDVHDRAGPDALAAGLDRALRGRPPSGRRRS